MTKRTRSPSVAAVLATVLLAAALTLLTAGHARAGVLAAPECPEHGQLTYTLQRAASPTSDQRSAYAAIDGAMVAALAFDNCYLAVTKALTVTYDPKAATAFATADGHLTFGDQRDMQQIAAMREISHALGVGTAPAWAPHVSGGLWTGAGAVATLRRVTEDPAAQLHADGQHFWPYGLDRTGDVTGAGYLRLHCLIVVALRREMGL